jgi:cellulose biosynthesis protein BcsQ
VNLAYAAAAAGRRVLVWDLDPQGAASYYFRVKPKVKGGARRLINEKRQVADFIKASNFENLELMPADFSYRNLDLYLYKRGKSADRLKRLLAPVRREYDYIILDCPPGITLVSENVFHAVDALLVPLIPTYLSVRAYDRVKRYLIKKLDTPPELLPFFSMVDRRRRLHRDLVEGFHRDHPEVLQTSIGYASSVERMGEYRAPVQVYDRRSEAAAAFNSLWEEIAGRLA